MLKRGQAQAAGERYKGDQELDELQRLEQTQSDQKKHKKG
jgi:hypothetical protein